MQGKNQFFVLPLQNAIIGPYGTQFSVNHYSANP